MLIYLSEVKKKQGETNPSTSSGDGMLTTHSELPGDLRSSPSGDGSTQPEIPGRVELAATDMSVTFNVRKKG